MQHFSMHDAFSQLVVPIGLLAITLGAVEAQAETPIDDFTSAEFVLQSPAAESRYTSQELASPGPIDLRLSNLVALRQDPGTVRLEVTDGQFEFSTENAPNGSLLSLGWFGDLQPGTSASGMGSLFSSDLMPFSPWLNLSDDSAFLIDYANLGPFAVSLQVFAYDGNLDDLQLDQSPIIALAAGSSGRLTVPFHEVFDNVDPAAVGGVGLSLLHTGDDGDLRLLRFVADHPVFADGFESGNVSTWSTSVP